MNFKLLPKNYYRNYFKNKNVIFGLLFHMFRDNLNLIIIYGLIDIHNCISHEKNLFIKKKLIKKTEYERLHYD